MVRHISVLELDGLRIEKQSTSFSTTVYRKNEEGFWAETFFLDANDLLRMAIFARSGQDYGLVASSFCDELVEKMRETLPSRV